MKVSQAHNDYFDVTLQTKDKTVRGVCFSPDKIKSFKSKYETTSPVKLTNYAIKRNRYTDEDEVHINKRTKLSDPGPSEIHFNFEPLKPEEESSTVSTVNDIIAGNTKSKVNIEGRVAFQETAQTIQANGKTLKKLEAVLTDETGSIRLVLWETDISRVQNGLTYNIGKALVKNYQDSKYITLNRQSTIMEKQMTIQRSDEQLIDNQVNKVCCPADGIEKFTAYLSCKKCNAAFPLNAEKKVLQCTNCGCAQLKDKCTKRTIIKALFMKEEERISLTIFDDKLNTLYNIYKQKAQIKPFCELTEEDIMEILLTVEATLFYNKKFNIISVKQKED